MGIYDEKEYLELYASYSREQLVTIYEESAIGTGPKKAAKILRKSETLT